MVSLDGFIAGLNGELNWHVVEEEFVKYAENMLNAADQFCSGELHMR